MDAQASRLLVLCEPGQRIGRDNNPPAAIERVDVDDPPGDLDRAEPALQYRRLTLPGGLADQRKPGAEQRQRQRRFAQQRTPVQRKARDAGGKGRAKPCP